jgi:hypothetical protein
MRQRHQQPALADLRRPDNRRQPNPARPLLQPDQIRGTAKQLVRSILYLLRRHASRSRHAVKIAGAELDACQGINPGINPVQSSDIPSFSNFFHRF